MLKNRWLIALVMMLASTRILGGYSAVAQAQQSLGLEHVAFQQQVLPILSEKCFLCHGPDSESREAGLRLDQPESAISELESGATAIVPGDLAKSELIRRITSQDDSERMPPVDSGKSLTQVETQLLKRWIEEGAEYQRHWSFEPITRPDVPEVRDSSWVRNPIDRFTLARMEVSKLRPSPAASPEKLARRIYFDLVGLPPTPTELQSFLADTSPAAVARLADSLFASPHYGELMAISWLDGARYADSNGYQNDFARQMWPWRDWVIRAFNNNMPYDQFVIDQLAGDLLPNPTQDQVIATGFNRNNRTVTEAGSLPEEWLVENAVDRVETTSTVFLGLTMGCARCHNHKYDPISQKEFYEFFAFFNNITEKGVYTEQRGNVAPLTRVPTTKQRAQLTDFDERITKLRRELSRTASNDEPPRDAWIQTLTTERASSTPTPTVQIPLLGDLSVISAAIDAVAPSRVSNLEWTNGFPGQALVLKGRGFEFGEIVNPQRNSSFSAALWVRPSTEGTLISKMDCAADHRGVDLILLHGFRPTVHLVHAWSEGDAIKVVARKSLPKDVWSHVAMTYDGSSKAAGVHLYVNGEPVDLEHQADNLSGSLYIDEPFRIGQRSNEFFINGSVTDVKLFESQLTRLEVRRTLEERVVHALVDHYESLDDQSQSELKAFCQTYLRAELQVGQSALDALEKEKTDFEKTFPTVMVMKERIERRPTYVLKRGQYHSPDKTQPVEPDVPDFLPPLPSGEQPARLKLARWIVSDNNPLTARVVVNRLWSRFFGRGLVKTAENFGVQAELPSHPKLLDWLAAELISSGWDLQHIQKLIVTSATYRQTSQSSSEKREQDPGNILLTRGPRLRLRAELVRDNALAISGLLNSKIGGPSVMPYQPQGLWEELAGGAHENYVQDQGDKLYRRSLYIYRKRTVPHPSMSTFNAPSWEICQVQRETTNTPLQALALLNDVTYVEAARKLADRMIAEGGDNKTNRLAYAFRLATGRIPNVEEVAMLRSALNSYIATFREDAFAASEYLAHGESPLEVTEESKVDLAAYAAVASVILNLDETLSKD